MISITVLDMLESDIYYFTSIHVKRLTCSVSKAITCRIVSSDKNYLYLVSELTLNPDQHSIFMLNCVVDLGCP